jgi:hypothetical protein
VALSIRISNEAASAELDAFTTLLDGGSLDLYDGAQPATADTPISTQALLVSLSLGNPSYVPAVDGVADLAAPVSGLCVASGIATWYRLTKPGGAPVQDGSVGLSGCNLNLTSTAIIDGATLVVDSLIQTQRKA